MVIDFRDPEKIDLSSNSIINKNHINNPEEKIKLKKKKRRQGFGFKIKLKPQKKEFPKEKPIEEPKTVFQPESSIQAEPKAVLRNKMKEKFSKEENILEKINRVLQEQQSIKNSSALIVEEEGNAEKETAQIQNKELSGTVSFAKDSDYEPVAKPEFEKFEFRGKGKEFFKIWIVNVALTLLTLGIYSAWAKVRTYRYIYGNTYLKGSNFEFNADPKRIFIGRSIIVAAYGLFLLFGKFLNMYAVAGGIVLLFALLFPWLMRQAISFKLKSASYRNIHFRYHGKVKSFYALALITIVSIAFIPLGMEALKLLGYKISAEIFSLVLVVSYLLIYPILMPIIYRRYKSLVINNSSFANASFEFNAKRRETIRLFLKIASLTFAVALVFGAVTAGIMGYLKPIIAHIPPEIKNNPNFGLAVSVISSIIYLTVTGMYKGISDAYLSNFARNHTTLEGAKFKGEIKPLKLGWISMTNMIMLVFTLGLAYPWTKFRYLRYKIENSYFACSNYDKFVSQGYEDTNPIGEEAMDFFDIDIGV